MTYHVGIYLFDDVEVLDFAGPFEVFSTAARVAAKRSPRIEDAFLVFTIAATADIVTARGGLQIRPRYDIWNHPPVELLIIPGGVVSEQLDRKSVTDWIKRAAGQTRVLASVCTGAFLIAQAGLLEGRRATTHWEDISEFRRRFPNVDVDENARWVDTGDVVTSAGISAGIDMSLYLIARLENEELALATARQMDYAWEGQKRNSLPK